MKVNQKNKAINNSNENKSNIKDDSQNKGVIYKKITKPIELENFDSCLHLQKNILTFDRNCKDKISEQSYYCISCQQSVCIKCGAYDHKDHILIQRDNCLFYDPNFFVEIEKILDVSLTLDTRKQSIKDEIEKSVSDLKNHLDQLKIIKFKELDDFFEKNNQNLNDLKKNFLSAKESIENYYKSYKKFFNIDYIKSSDAKIIIKEDDLANNLDVENTVFIINFDLMNLCDSINLKVLDKINDITIKVNSINDIIEQKVKDLIQIINMSYNFDLDKRKFEDFYDEVKIRIQKYDQIIHSFQETVADIVQKTGSIDKIKEVLEIFDSKNKKSKDIIFQQSFFQNDKTNEINIKKEKINDTNTKEKKINNWKSNNQLLISTDRSETKDKNVKVNLCPNNKVNKTKNSTTNSRSSKKIKAIVSPNKNYHNKIHIDLNNYLSENSGHALSNNTLLSNRTASPSKFNKNDVTLNNRILQRFFAYSLNDFYVQNISKDNANNEKAVEDNKPKKKKTKSNANKSSSCSKDNQNLRKFNTNKININKKNLFSNEFNTNSNDEEEMDANQYNLKSVSYLANYQNRFNSLKERIKPIIGTNHIQIFDPSTKKIIKKTTSLNKEEHGYSIFPDGCRHILIDNILYITGGNNNCGYIVLSYDVLTNVLTRLPNFVYEHSFHTLDYVDNFDCIICVGGENSSSCEIMDINSKKWKKLPNLNYPRANASIYYNNITEQIYILFGMNGNIWKNNKNCDKIEVIDLKNIDNGWINVDYYKGSGLDLKLNFCKTMPFTKDKLIIFGGNNVRSSMEAQNFYALFDMNKNEIFPVDKQTMELIKLEEKKIRLFDLALTKIK